MILITCHTFYQRYNNSTIVLSNSLTNSTGLVENDHIVSPTTARRMNTNDNLGVSARCLSGERRGSAADAEGLVSVAG